MAAYALSRIKSRIVPAGEKPRTIPFGLFRGVRLDIDLNSQSQLYFGLYEREIAPWLRRLSRGAETALDIGANQGAYSMFFLRNTDARVIAFEPDADAARRLLRSASLNPSWRLKVRQEFAGPTPLDSLLPLTFPVVVKMDIEGWEADALRTASELMRGDSRWIVETHSPSLEMECLDIFGAAGLQTKVVKHAWWRRFVPERRPHVQSWIIAARRF